MKPVMLLGPTASGKSAVAMALAERFPVEIVSVDSAQVYRLLDIGTAKPSRAERARVPHHLIDIIDPEDSYSAARFAADAHRLVTEISARGRLPLLVGGTMLYAKALCEGLHALPPASAELRAELDREAEQIGWPALHTRLAGVDPATAARLAPGDSQRIQRALEVYLLTGQPLSHWIAQQRSDAAPPLEALRIALEPSDRSVLHARIETRFRAMLAAGLIDEVKQLRERPTLHPELPALRSVGYRQVWAWLDQPGPMETLANAGIAATRQLAKRQLTWLRSDPGRVVIDCLAPDCADQVARHLISIS
ncbi:MAG: tRNA (adenosine(37)-N6)-dimethylallyltransferase MiaA [Betaproteobacteria bacterium]|nr:tRNA (adenosine(37)-N6)-dimethylallyltransferase MiaA [Betaproteobacteria bacterium]